MNISLIRGCDLTPALKATWDQLKTTAPLFQSPYYTWQYIDALLHVGRPIEIAIIEDKQTIVGFLPFERTSRWVMAPAGLFLTDYQGWIGSPQLNINLKNLLRSTGTRYVHFDHMPTQQTAWGAHACTQSPSPMLDLSQGWQAYLKQLATQQGREVAGIVPRVRERIKISKRQFERVHLDFDVRDHAFLDWIMQQKSRQYQNSPGAKDVFAVAWVRQLMHHILDTQDPAFKGLMCKLMADDTPIAGHFGMQSHAMLHAWFPVYDSQYAHLSPGLIMFHELARLAPDNHIDWIDLGRGPQDYKLRFMTHANTLNEGIVSNPQWLGNGQMTMWRIKHQAKQQPWLVNSYRTLQSWGQRQ